MDQCRRARSKGREEGGGRRDTSQLGTALTLVQKVFHSWCVWVAILLHIFPCMQSSTRDLSFFARAANWILSDGELETVCNCCLMQMRMWKMTMTVS